MAQLHAPVLDALRSGDAALAEDAIRQHFSTARASLAERWPDADVAPVADAPAVATPAVAARDSAPGPVSA